MTRGTTLGVLGGTFDPIHVGHLDAAGAARATLGLDRVRLVPSGAPPHRPSPPVAGPDARLAMGRLAIAGHDGYEVSDAELTRAGRSYTADTLRVLAADGWTPTQLFFILGLDAFSEISTWHEFPAVLEGAHFVVIARPGATSNVAMEHLPVLRARLRTSITFHDAPGTAIIPIEARTRDVSSSGIRARLAAGESIDGLVPPPVARYIHKHHLYTPTGRLNDGHEQA